MEAAAPEGVNAKEIAAWLTRGRFAATAARGGVLVVGIGDPPQAVFATPETLAIFGVKDIGALDEVLFGADSPGARRLIQLARSLSVSAAPRLESLRFFVGRMPIPVGWQCARIPGPEGTTLFVAAAPIRSVDESPLPAKASAEAPTPAVVRQERVEPAAKPRLVDSPVRFLWTADAEGRFGAPDAALVARVGSHAMTPGETPSQLHSRIGFDPDESWSRAIDARRTFAGLKLPWPEPGDARARIALISGAPVFDRERRFCGFRGFGMFPGESIAIAPAPTVEIEPLSSVEALASPSDASVEAGETLNEHAAPPPVSTDEPANEEDGETRASDDAARNSSDFAEIHSAGRSDSLPAVIAQRSDPAQIAPARIGREGGAEIFVLRPAGAPSPQKVVPIRPGALGVLAPTSDEPDPPRGSGDNVELTPQERDAFKEIARALGVRPRGPRQEPAEEASTARPPTPTVTPVNETSTPVETSVELGRRDLAALLDHLPIGALVVRAGETVYLNRTLLDLTGYASLEIFRAEEGLKHIFRGRDPEAIAPAGEGGGIPLVAAGGELLTMDAQARPIPWDGAPALLISLRRSREADHQAQVRAIELEAERHAARASDLSAALDLAVDGMIRLDASGRILGMNARAESLFGYDQNEAAGESFLMLFAPSAQAGATAALDRAIREESPSPENEALNLAARERSGRSVPVRLDIGRLTTSGAPEYFALVRDLSRSSAAEDERETARDSAEKASARKTELLARVSHEIRTPLHAILGFAEVIMEERFGPVGNERYKDYIKDIHASGKHVMSLANDLLDLAKIEAGKMELQFAPVDANKVIRESVALMQPQAARARIIMRLSLFDKLPNVMADERSLRQIMLNLMSNAVKFNEPGGQVIISTALDETGHTVIRVRDTGIGMNEHELGVALEPFRRVGGRHGDGAGLGLPLTKALAEANHADFSIKSRKEHGTLVEVAFPVARAAQ